MVGRSNSEFIKYLKNGSQNVLEQIGEYVCSHKMITCIAGYSKVRSCAGQTKACKYTASIAAMYLCKSSDSLTPPECPTTNNATDCQAGTFTADIPEQCFYEPVIQEPMYKLTAEKMMNMNPCALRKTQESCESITMWGIHNYLEFGCSTSATSATQNICRDLAIFNVDIYFRANQVITDNRNTKVYNDSLVKCQKALNDNKLKPSALEFQYSRISTTGPVAFLQSAVCDMDVSLNCLFAYDVIKSKNKGLACDYIMEAQRLYECLNESTIPSECKGRVIPPKPTQSWTCYLQQWLGAGKICAPQLTNLITYYIQGKNPPDAFKMKALKEVLQIGGCAVYHLEKDCGRIKDQVLDDLFTRLCAMNPNDPISKVVCSKLRNMPTSDINFLMDTQRCKTKAVGHWGLTQCAKEVSNDFPTDLLKGFPQINTTTIIPKFRNFLCQHQSVKCIMGFDAIKQGCDQDRACNYMKKAERLYGCPSRVNIPKECSIATSSSSRVSLNKGFISGVTMMTWTIMLATIPSRYYS